MSQSSQQTLEYVCPGEKSPVSRSVHLGRLATFYPACRGCPHRDDTGTLSARQVKRLVETRFRGRRRPLFGDEGAAGVYLNDLDPATAGRMAAALGIYLRRGHPHTEDPPVVLIAGDGRHLTPEVVAAIADRLRWTGCNLVDVGPATAGCLAFAIDELQASGGLLVGNPSDQAHTIGLKFWAGGPHPMSGGGSLDAVRHIFETGADRPTRKSGSLARYQADVPYLAELAESYHALRPLRFVLDTNCRPLAEYLEKLTAPVACRAVPRRTAPDRLAKQIAADDVHFGTRIDSDGERCRLWDEQGRPVADEHFFLLLARHLLADQPQGPVVVEEGAPQEVVRKIRDLGACVLTSDARRSEMDRTMRRHDAFLGGGPSGRFWHRSSGNHVAADALVTVTHLLQLLSQSDRPLSRVLASLP